MYSSIVKGIYWRGGNTRPLFSPFLLTDGFPTDDGYL